MPRGRTPGAISRKPGIFGQSFQKLRNEEGSLDRSRLNIVIEFNDASGNRFKQVLEARMKKDGSGIFIPPGGAVTVISEAPEANVEPETVTEAVTV